MFVVINFTIDQDVSGGRVRSEQFKIIRNMKLLKGSWCLLGHYTNIV